MKRSISATSSRFRMGFRVAICVLSFLALGALISVGVAAATSGIHFVIIQSAQGQAAAERVVAKINEDLAKKGVGGLHARAYPSGGGNRWYSVVVGRAKKAAEERLQKARQVIPDSVRPGPWIRSYDLREWIRGQVEKMTSATSMSHPTAET